MQEENKLQSAISLLVQGRRKEASTELLSLEKIITDKNLRIQLIDAALSALDPVKENETLIRLSTEAINIAREYQKNDSQAFFMGRKADFLEGSITFLHYEQQNIKLSPDWLEFSTEQDKDRYEELTKRIEEINSEIDSLLSKAFILAEASNKKDIIARIFMSAAGIESARYFYKKADKVRGGLYTKLWLKIRFMRYPFFENLFIFSQKKKKELAGLVKSFKEKFLKAADIFTELNDPMAGYVYCNLANSLNSAYKFSEAKKYLLKALELANHFNDALLKKHIESLEKTINSKNRDIPDYVNGESRWDSL